MELLMEEVNSRIVRLSIGLGISLKDETSLALATSERRTSTDRRSGSRASTGMERRIDCKRAELRGLLIMRYGIQQKVVEQVGVTHARFIMTTAEAHLERDGFSPGADGIDLKRMFDAS